MKINAVTPNYNVNKNTQSKNNAPQSFKGAVPEPVKEGLSKFYTNVANSNGFQKFIKGFSKSDRTFTHVMVAESVLLSSFYMINTLRNKKIKKEQKPQMLINDTLTLGVSAAGAYLLDDKVSKVVSNISDNFIKKHSDFYANDAEKIANFKAGMGKLKTIVVFGMIYRYLGPVLITPLANKLSSKFFNNDKKAKEPEKTEQSQNKK